MNARDLFAGQTWAIEGAAFGRLLRQIDSLSALAVKGIAPNAAVGPIEKGYRAAFAENTIEADIDRNGMATVELVGVALTRVPYWAHFMGLEVFSLNDARAAIEGLTANRDVAGLTLVVDSPGGSVNGTAELAAAIKAFRATGRPVHVKASGMVASAMYWIASAADSISVTPSTMVGSIGTLVVLEDSTAADAKAGLSYTVVSSGGVKGAGADGKVTPELVGMVKQIVDQLTAQFIGAVAANRNMSPDAVKALATGDVWFGADAKARGLVDTVAGEAAPASTTPAPTSTPSPEPAPGAEGSAMSLKISNAVLATLMAAFAADAPAVLADAEAGMDEAGIRANADKRKATAALTEQVATLTRERDEARAATTAKQTELDATKATLASTTAELNKLKGIQPPKDVGAGGQGAKPTEVKRADWEKNQAKYAADIAKGLVVVVD